jgi:hypothetical protein
MGEIRRISLQYYLSLMRNANQGSSERFENLLRLMIIRIGNQGGIGTGDICRGERLIHQ